jgi:hypothetical protein
VSSCVPLRALLRSRFTSPLTCLIATLTLGLACVHVAHAFQNPDTFPADPTQGGGGGRFFTGAPLDAFTCEVCHRSESAPSVHVYGLPPGAYQAGALYRVTIDWPDELERVALMMEMTDRRGLAVGTWTDVDPASLTPADQCTLTSDTPTGTRILPLDGPRAVISAIDCGQHQTTLNWIAPAQTDPLVPVQLPDAILSGAIVVSNTNGKLAGDDAASFARNLAAPGAMPVAATDVLARCETTRPHGTTRGAGLTCLVALLSALRLRARTRKRPRRLRPQSKLQADSEQREAFDIAKRVCER